jgi:perosamine synthetase
MDVSGIEARITSKTKAIIVVHIYGLPVDMNQILQLAEKYNLVVIEDAAEMNGQTYYGKKCGSFGTISVFSFYANKVVSTGEGGMILCDDPAVAARCKKLRNLAFEPEKPRFVHYEMGYNYRMTNMQAALGLAQLEQVERFVEKKRFIGKYYNEGLAFLSNFGYQLPVSKTAFADNIYWVYSLLPPTEEEKNRVVTYLASAKIGTRPFFWCMHEQPVFQKLGLFKNERYSVAEKLARCGFYIPSGLGITEAEMQRVVETFKQGYE